jgi:hypothetical protein
MTVVAAARFVCKSRNGKRFDLNRVSMEVRLASTPPGNRFQNEEKGGERWDEGDHDAGARPGDVSGFDLSSSTGFLGLEGSSM